jgi:hypothetical protein
MKDISSKARIPEIAANALQGLMDRAGAVLYSSHETIQPGSIYLMGLNPGGCGGPSLRERIAGLLANESNAYMDEAWENERSSYELGEAPLQRRVKWLLSNLGVNPRDVLSTNLIFVQSRDATGVSFDLAKQCWPVHEALLSIVKPRIILAFGNSGFSPYGFLHSLYGGEQRFGIAGHGSWSLKGFSAEILENRVFVAGLPHLSRYCPIDKQHVIRWIMNEGRT